MTSATEPTLRHASHPPPPPSRSRALVKALRPRQWTKNLLVAAAPAAAGLLTEPAIAADVLVAFAVFCLAASATYLINDVVDAPADRLHPVKCSRPIAAGQLPSGIALVLGITGLAVAVTVAGIAVSGGLAFVVAAYAVMMVAYTLWLKHYVLIDVAVIAGGFILRAIAGGVATGTPLSEWFIIVASFGALLLAAGKRHAEVAVLGQGNAAHRSVLLEYTPAFTQYLLTLGSGVTAVAYCLWALDAPRDVPLASIPWLMFSVIPFVLALLRYGLLALSGRGGEPEELALRDRQLQFFGGMWLILVIVGIYG